MVTKITILNDKSIKKLATYDAQLIPMMGDMIDVPKHGVMKVVKRIFDVDAPDEVVIVVSR